mmetsp:Transcript_6573/g.21593  ORF Transcript_6573/g.21593 Transcript_6573/m.21593 type:complete len:200 (+) Transcript_6573:83-682(+)
MGLVFTGLVYVSGYLFLIFVAICLACGLYYLAELAEEYNALTRRLLSCAIAAVLIVHILLLALEPHLPYVALAAGFANHIAYLWLHQSYPLLRIASPAFLTSLGLFGVSHYLWGTHFLAHYHQLAHVLCFFLFNVWLVPFGFFISLSVNEARLPNTQAGLADEVYSEGGGVKQKSGLLSAFSFVREKRDDMMPSMAKKV